MNLKYILIVITSIAAAGCSSMTYTTKQETSEKNKPVTSEIKCVALSACEAKAAELCADGYNVVSRTESVPYVLNKMQITCKTKAPPPEIKKEEPKLDDAMIEIEKELQK